MARYSFSGHETFTCKSLWLKKGYDFLQSGYVFTADDAVVRLGVGKNMVNSIRFWLKAFGMTQNDKLTEIADYFFEDKGRDPYTEDINTLWILHYLLVTSQIASLYYLLFLDLQREQKTFDREQLQAFVKRRCSVPEQKNVYNENTVKKDIGVLLSTYVIPESKKTLEDFNALLIDLGLIRKIDHRYSFNQTNPKQIAPEVILFALLDYCKKNETHTLSFDALQEIALIFSLSIPDLISILQVIVKKYAASMSYQDNAGVKNVLFNGKELDSIEVLDRYFKNA